MTVATDQVQRVVRTSYAHLEVMAQFFEVDFLVLVEIGGRQCALDANDLLTLDVQFAQQVAVSLSSQTQLQPTTTRLVHGTMPSIDQLRDK